MARESMREIMQGVEYDGKPRLVANNTVQYRRADRMRSAVRRYLRRQLGLAA